MDEMENRLARLPGALLPWYRENRRVLPWREEVSAYRTWVSEIMLQQTRVAAVIPYFQRFMAAYPTVEDLAACDEGELMRLWAGLGYYSRARNLRRAARVIAEEYGGAFPRTYQELMALPGVGDYTAGAILSIAFGEPVPAVDGNVLRVAARVGGCELDILDPRNRRQFRRRMEAVMPRQEPGAFNQALMDLGAGICLPGGAPLCDTCPAADFCAAREQGRQREEKREARGASDPVHHEERGRHRGPAAAAGHGTAGGPVGISPCARPADGGAGGPAAAAVGADAPGLAAAAGRPAYFHPHPLGDDRLPGAGGGPGPGGLALGRRGPAAAAGDPLRL